MADKELKQKIKTMQEAYASELAIKDRDIAELKEQNLALLKASLEQSKKIEELTEKLRLLTKKE